MLYRPSDLADPAAARFRATADAVRDAQLAAIGDALADLGDDALAQLLYDHAFEQNDALPKRARRPKLEPAILATAVFTAAKTDDSHPAIDDEGNAGASGERRVTAGRGGDTGDDSAPPAPPAWAGDAPAPLLATTAASQELFDVLDDLADGDVGAEKRSLAVVVATGLASMAVDGLATLGSDLTHYWADATVGVLQAPQIEARRDPSATQYEAVLDAQSILYGHVGGMAAALAGGPRQQAERIGRACYRHAALVLDYEQAMAAASTESWNGWHLFDESTFVEKLTAERRTVEDAVADYPDEQAAVLRGLVSLDVPAWRADVRARA